MKRLSFSRICFLLFSGSAFAGPVAELLAPTTNAKRRSQNRLRPERHRVWRKPRFVPCLFTTTLIALVLTAGPTSGQVTGSAVIAGATSGNVPGFALQLPAVPIEKVADVILVLKPNATLPLQVSVPTERIVQGDIVRVEKGVVPQMIVHTPNTIVSSLQAGVPVKLFLKSFTNRNAHYIIGVFPESYGGQP